MQPVRGIRGLLRLLCGGMLRPSRAGARGAAPHPLQALRASPSSQRAPREEVRTWLSSDFVAWHGKDPNPACHSLHCSPDSNHVWLSTPCTCCAQARAAGARAARRAPGQARARAGGRPARRPGARARGCSPSAATSHGAPCWPPACPPARLRPSALRAQQRRPVRSIPPSALVRHERSSAQRPHSPPLERRPSHDAHAMPWTVRQQLEGCI